MVQKLFYLRNNGNITGPFTFEQLKKMQNSHLLNTQDMVSENRVSWQNIEEFLTVLPKNKKTGKKRTMELRPEEMPASKYGRRSSDCSSWQKEKYSGKIPSEGRGSLKESIVIFWELL